MSDGEANDQPLIYGYAASDYEKLPDWLRTFITESHDRNAHAHHADHRAQKQAWADQAWQSADLVIKLLATLHGGALVAILAFLGSMMQRGVGVDSLPWLYGSLAVFGAGLLLTFACATIAYFTVFYFLSSSMEETLSFEKPFVFGTDASNRLVESGNRLRRLGVIFAILGMLAAPVAAGLFARFTYLELTRTQIAAYAAPTARDLISAFSSSGNPKPAERELANDQPHEAPEEP